MSMNINLKATIVGTFIINSNKIEKEIQDDFVCIQTPTNITKQILKSKDSYNEYKNFIKERFQNFVEEIFLYNQDDYFEEEEPIDIIYQNNGDIHINKLDKFITDHDGWNIKWYEL